MRRALLILTCLALIGVAGNATAGSALGLLKLNKDTINQLEDEDYEGFATPFVYDNLGNIVGGGQAIDLSQVPAGTFLIPPQGAFLLSMWNVQKVKYLPGSDNKNPTTDAFTALAVGKVASVTPGANPGDATLSLVPLTATEWGQLITNGLLPAGSTPTAVGSFGTLYSDGVKDNDPSWIDPDVDGDSSPTPSFQPADWATDFGTALGLKLWEFGFTGLGGAAQNGETWVAEIDNTGLSTGVNFTALLNQTADFPATAGITLLPHDFFNVGGGVNFWQFQLDGEIDTPTLIGDGFYLTDTNIYIRPVPEPGSLVLLGLGLFAVGTVVRRRRK